MKLILIVTVTMLAASPAAAEIIHLFARKGDVDKVMAEVGNGVPIDLPSTKNTTERGVSPLFIASKFGKTEVVRALLDAGADFRTLFDPERGYDPYGTSLHVAAAWGQVEVVRLLVEAGAEVDSYHPRIGTPLHLALKAGRDDVAQVLRNAGAVARIEIPFSSGDVAAADLELGREVGIGCGSCHAMEKDQSDAPKIGPNLWNIVSRPKASDGDFEYSSEMLRDQGAWTYAALNSFLAAPKRYLPGIRMNVSGIDDKSRRSALIAFLATLSADPVPLP